MQKSGAAMPRALLVQRCINDQVISSVAYLPLLTDVFTTVYALVKKLSHTLGLFIVHVSCLCKLRCVLCIVAGSFARHL